jgi:hypothetical protein
VDPISDPLLVRKFGSTGNRAGTCGSVARNSDHKATEAVASQAGLNSFRLIY